MAGAMRKMGIYLGLVEDDQYADEYEHPRQSARQRDHERDREQSPEVDEYDEIDDAEVERNEPVATMRQCHEEQPPVIAAVPAPSEFSRRRFEAAPVQDWSTDDPAEPADEPRDDEAGYRITTLHPRTYNEARAVGEQFRAGTPVIMNLTEMDDADAKRLVDFAAGLTFALRGSIERITTKVFLLSPQKVKVSAEQKAQIISSGSLLRHG